MTSRRTAALELIHQTTKSEKDKLHRMFGVRDWSILLKYAYFYVSWFSHLRLFKRRSPQPRPETWGLGRGRSLIPMGLWLQTQELSFYMHIYADQSAMLGPDTRKVLMPELCDLLGNGEVGIICFLPPFLRLTFKSRYSTAADFKILRSTMFSVPTANKT